MSLSGNEPHTDSLQHHAPVDLLDRRAGPPLCVAFADIAHRGRDAASSRTDTRPVLVVVGDGMTLEPQATLAAEAFFDAVLLPHIVAHDAVVIDGGTNAGIMAAIGQARARNMRPFHLIGVAPAACVDVQSCAPGQPNPHASGKSDVAAPEPHHSWLVTTPGTSWGAECPYMMRLAAVLAGDFPVTVIVHGGGRVTRMDVEHAVAHGFGVVALRGTGRVADALANAQLGRIDETELGGWASAIVASHPVEVLPIGALDVDVRHWFVPAKTS